MVLFIAVLVLALMGALAVASIDTASRDRQAAGYYNRSNNALFAADAGVAHAIALIKADGSSGCPKTIAFATQGTPALLGDTTTYMKYGDQPKYYGLPAAGANAIQCTGYRNKGGGMSRIGSRPPARYAQWMVQIVGESADGSQSRLEVLHEEEV
jgi:hypothetical protein